MALNLWMTIMATIKFYRDYFNDKGEVLHKAGDIVNHGEADFYVRGSYADYCDETPEPTPTPKPKKKVSK